MDNSQPDLAAAFLEAITRKLLERFTAEAAGDPSLQCYQSVDRMDADAADPTLGPTRYPARDVIFLRNGHLLRVTIVGSSSGSRMFAANPGRIFGMVQWNGTPEIQRRLDAHEVRRKFSISRANDPSTVELDADGHHIVGDADAIVQNVVERFLSDTNGSS